MSDMTIEKARQYVSTHGPMCAIQPCGHLDDRSAQHCHYCRGFIAGHASRDPEVADLKKNFLSTPLFSPSNATWPGKLNQKWRS